MALRAWNHRAHRLQQGSGFRGFRGSRGSFGSVGGVVRGTVRHGGPFRGTRSTGASWEQGYYQGLLQAMGNGIGRASSRSRGKGYGKNRAPVQSFSRKSAGTMGKAAGKGRRVLSKFDKSNVLARFGLRGFYRGVMMNPVEKSSGGAGVAPPRVKGSGKSGGRVQSMRKDAGRLAKSASKGGSHRVVSKFTKPRAVGGQSMLQGGVSGKRGKGGGRRLGKGNGKGKGGKAEQVTVAGLDKELAGYFGISAKEQEKQSGAAAKLDMELDKYMSQV